MKTIHTFLLVGCVVFWASGCATGPQGPTADAEPQRLEIDGLAISVQPMTGKAEVKKTFKENLLAKGVLPIRLTVENRSASASFIIAREKILVISDITGATNSSPQHLAARDLAATPAKVWRERQLVTAAQNSPILFLIAAMNPPDGDVIDRQEEYNLASKEFYTRTVGPGQKAGGFLFFQFLKQTDSLGAFHVILQVKNSSTDVVKPFDFKVNLNSIQQ